MQNVVNLVKRRSNPEIVLYLQELLEEARQGKVVGLIAAAHYGGQDICIAGAGSVCADPHIAAGMLALLPAKFFPTGPTII